MIDQEIIEIDITNKDLNTKVPIIVTEQLKERIDAIEDLQKSNEKIL